MKQPVVPKKKSVVIEKESVKAPIQTRDPIQISPKKPIIEKPIPPKQPIRAKKPNVFVIPPKEPVNVI